jgi:hypothetical protein
MVTESMNACEFAPAIEPVLTSPSEVLQSVEIPRVGKAPSPKGIPNRGLRHVPKTCT